MDNLKLRRERALAVTYAFHVDNYGGEFDEFMSSIEADKIIIRDNRDRILTPEERSELINLIACIPEVRDCYLWRLREEETN